MPLSLKESEAVHGLADLAVDAVYAAQQEAIGNLRAVEEVIEGGELPRVRGIETIAVVPGRRAILRCVGVECAEVVPHAVVTRCVRDEDL